MFRFFRSIRHRLLAESKTSRYMAYALGEIVLVVIGILIALSINTWNHERVIKISIDNYFLRIHDELESEEANLTLWSEQNHQLANMNEKALYLMRTEDVDSIEVFKELLGSVATAWEYTVKTPIIDEFLNNDYLSLVEDDSLKLLFRDYLNIKERVDGHNAYIVMQYHNSIEPFFVKHINYSQVAMQSYREGLVQGGPSPDYKALYGNLALWNIITFKLETCEASYRYADKARSSVRKLRRMIGKELNRKRSTES